MFVLLYCKRLLLPLPALSWLFAVQVSAGMTSTFYPLSKDLRRSCKHATAPVRLHLPFFPKPRAAVVMKYMWSNHLFKPNGSVYESLPKPISRSNGRRAEKDRLDRVRQFPVQDV